MRWLVLVASAWAAVGYAPSIARDALGGNSGAPGSTPVRAIFAWCAGAGFGLLLVLWRRTRTV